MINNNKNKNRLNSKGIEKIFGNGINDIIKEIENNNILNFKINEINISNILFNPYQPRKIFNNNELKELSISIKKYGIIQPIIVKKSIKENDFFYLISGERRIRASKMIDLKKIPAIIVDFNDLQMKEIALIENIQRVNLNPIEEAIAYKELIDLLNITQKELSNRIGKSRSHIANTMRLLSLSKEIQKYILDGILTMGQVKSLIALQSFDKDNINIKKIVNKIIDEKLNSRQVEDIVRSYLKNNNKNLKINKNNLSNKHEFFNKFLEKKIKKILNTNIIIKSNKIIIDYNGIKELNRILNILGLINKK